MEPLMDSYLVSIRTFTSNLSPIIPDLNLPITLCKGTCRYTTEHPIYNFVSYHSLSLGYSTFISSFSSISLPKTITNALSHLGWQDAKVEEIFALHSNRTWNLVPLRQGKSTIGCHWVFTITVGLDGHIDRPKARLTIKGYTQIFCLIYGDTFSNVAKISFICYIACCYVSLASPLG